MYCRICIVSVNQHIATGSLVIFIYKPIFQSVHQLSADVLSMSLECLIYAETSNQDSRITAMAFLLRNLSLQSVSRRVVKRVSLYAVV